MLHISFQHKLYKYENTNFYRDVICVGFSSQSYEIEVKMLFYIFGRVGVGITCELFLLVHDLYIRYTELFALRFFFIRVYPAAYVPKTFSNFGMDFRTNFLVGADFWYISKRCVWVCIRCQFLILDHDVYIRGD